MSAIAREVSRRMTTEYAKERAGEMARATAYRARDRALDSPWMLPLLGAGAGALIARALTSELGRRRESRERERSFEAERSDRGYRGAAYGTSAYDGGQVGGDEGETSSGAKMKDELAGRAEDAKERIADKASDYLDQARGAARSFRDRLPHDAGELRERASEQLALWFVGALTLGALFGIAAPITRSERRIVEPAKEKLRDLSEQAVDRAKEAGQRSIEGAIERAATSLSGGSHQQKPGEEPGHGEIEQPPAVH